MPVDTPAVRFLVVIPARYASSRLPGKVLLAISGKPMIQHVYERASRAGAKEVIVATDDERIRAAAAGFGARVHMTSTRHRSGTERIAQVARDLGWDDDQIVVNVQGDEPQLPPELVPQVAADLARRPEVDMTTLCQPLGDARAVFDPNVVKVVVDAAGHALYFSRAPIPWCRDDFGRVPPTLPPASSHLRHIGIYAYRAAFLARYARMPAGSLAAVESLEQLRVLEQGGRIHVEIAIAPPGPGVDTAADLARIRAQMGTE